MKRFHVLSKRANVHVRLWRQCVIACTTSPRHSCMNIYATLETCSFERKYGVKRFDSNERLSCSFYINLKTMWITDVFLSRAMLPRTCKEKHGWVTTGLYSWPINRVGTVWAVYHIAVNPCTSHYSLWRAINLVTSAHSDGCPVTPRAFPHSTDELRTSTHFEPNM